MNPAIELRPHQKDAVHRIRKTCARARYLLFSSGAGYRTFAVRKTGRGIGIETNERPIWYLIRNKTQKREKARVKNENNPLNRQKGK